MQTIYEASILLVDDNPDLLVLVGDSLRTAGVYLHPHRCHMCRGPGTVCRCCAGVDDFGHQPAGRRRLYPIAPAARQG